MFELHIEQGPILEAEEKMIGVVTGVQGMRWYEVTVTGQEAHTGATPMKLRKNALLGAARMIEAIHQVGMRSSAGRRERRPHREPAEQPQCRAGRGVLHRRSPPSRRDRARQRWRRTISAALPKIAGELKLELDGEAHLEIAGGEVRAGLIDCVRHGAEQAGFSTRDMASGAGHDAAYIARVAPTTMIFVPCLGGISHNEAESTHLRGMRGRRPGAAQRGARL